MMEGSDRKTRRWGARLAPAKAEPVASLLPLFIERNFLASGIVRHEVVKAWNGLPGVGNHTVSTYFRDGVLRVTVDSSLLRSRLSCGREALLKDLNAALDESEILRLAGISERVNDIILR